MMNYILKIRKFYARIDWHIASALSNESQNHFAFPVPQTEHRARVQELFQTVQTAPAECDR